MIQHNITCIDPNYGPQNYFLFSAKPGVHRQEYILIWGNYELNKWNLWKLNKKTKVEISISIPSKKKQKVIFQRNLNLNKYNSFCKIVAAKCSICQLSNVATFYPGKGIDLVVMSNNCHDMPHQESETFQTYKLF